MVKPTVVYHFDFGSPNCYLLHKIIPDIEARTGATVEYLPILLGGLMKLTNNQPPMLAFGGVKGKLEYMNVEMNRYVQHYGISDFAFNPHFPINTLPLMRGAVAAQRLDCFMNYVNTCFDAMWAKPVNMGDPTVVHQVLSDAGLPVDDILALTQDAGIKQTLLTNTQHSADRGNFGAPTMFVGDAMFFGKENIALLEGEIARQSVDSNGASG